MPDAECEGPLIVYPVFAPGESWTSDMLQECLTCGWIAAGSAIDARHESLDHVLGPLQ